MTKKEQTFVSTVWQYYKMHGRHALPWRQTTNPYRILVSEIMLQQTQVDRVVPKYCEFLKLYPTAQKLAAAPLGDVLRAWQGLGYNRRAKFLHLAAQTVVIDLKGKWPKDEAGLRSLPGVGPYTAGAVLAFAYDQPVVLIETNVRQVYLHHFFKKTAEVHDTDIVKRVTETLQANNPRQWYWALMDYGAYLKQRYGSLNHQSKHYTKQSNFHGSDRQIRGAILKHLSTCNVLTAHALSVHLGTFKDERVAAQLARLVAEGLVHKNGNRYRLY